MKRKTHASPAQSGLAMSTKPRRRRALTALFAAALALLLALPAFASADPLGSLTLFSSGLRTNALVRNVTEGPDGNVWFIDNKQNAGTPAIGRVKSSTEINEFIPGTNLTGLGEGTDLVSIAAGPDGNLWFTDKGTTPAIGAVNPASPESATEYSAGLNPGAKPLGIAAGPDGNLWFTDIGTTAAIGVINPSTHAIEEFSTGLAEGSKPRGIAAGPDGNLWFTDTGTTRAVGRINPSTHEITEFPTGAETLPGGSTEGPWGIVAGPDGNVWVTDSGALGKGIKRITPSGEITNFKAGLLPSSAPVGLTASAGKLWFTDGSGTNEKQQLVISAAENLGGTYKLGFKGQETGATGSGNLLSSATGKGDVKRFPASGNTSCKRSPGSKELKGCATTANAEVGMRITGTGIPAETTITKIEGTTISISNPATATLPETNTTNINGGRVINFVTESGKLEVGQPVSGTGINTNSFVFNLEESEGKASFALTATPTAAGTGVSLSTGAATATKTVLTGVTTSAGAFSTGLLVTKGAGIPEGTTITAINTNLKTLTLSAAPTTSGTGVELKADLRYNAPFLTIAAALEKIAGPEVIVDGSGTASPIVHNVTFEAALGNLDLEQITCNGAGLTGSSPSCAVTTTIQGVPNAIGRISTSGSITRYPQNVPQFVAVGITNGPGGNVWFSNGGTAPKIGKFGIEPKAPPTLTVNFEEGTGSVVSNPAGLECGSPTPGSCDEGFPEGTKVVLTASPAPGYAVKSWKGCDAGGVNGRQCTVTLSSSKSVGVKFYKVWNLKVTKSNPNGIAGTSPGGVNCGYGCLSSAADYKEGALTIKAKPAKNFHFVEFTGGTGAAASCNGVTAETCSISNFNENSAIEEVYAENTKNALTLVKEGGGQAFIKTKPSSVNCGYTCGSAKAEFFASESPEVSVALNKGTTSVTWVKGAGTCTGNALTCTVPMSEAHELVAKLN